MEPEGSVHELIVEQVRRKKMFQVVSCGYPAAPLTSLPAHRDVAAVPHPRAADFMQRSLDLLVPQLDAHRDSTILMVHDGSRASTLRVRMLRSMLRSPRVLPVGLPVPVTGLAAAATLLATFAAAGRHPGMVTGSLPWVRTVVPIDTVTASVSRLDHPGIGMRHHLRTLLPGTTIRLRFAERLVIGACGQAFPSGVRIGLVRAGNDALARRAAPPGASVEEVVDIGRIPDFDRAWWGTRSYYERAAVPLDATAMNSFLNTRNWVRCPHCHDAMDSVCPFCSAQEVYS